MNLRHQVGRILGLIGALAWLATAPLPVPAAPQADEQTDAQTAPTAPGVLRTEANLVVVDVVAVDKKGEYVRDLEMTDFRVFEDNEEQSITSFSHSSEAKETQGQPRYLVLFFDNSTMDAGEQARARQAAAQFVEKSASNNRMMAVVDFGGSLRIAQNFTADGDALKRAVGGVKFGGMQPNERGQKTQIAQLGPPSAIEVRSNYAARSVLLAIRNLARTLGTVAGRKTLILFSGGFPLNNERRTELTATIDAANKANVAVYPVDVRGLEGLKPLMEPGVNDPLRRGQPGFNNFPPGAELREDLFPRETPLLAASQLAGITLPRPLLQRPAGGTGGTVSTGGGGGGTTGGGGGTAGGGGSRGGGTAGGAGSVGGGTRGTTSGTRGTSNPGTSTDRGRGGSFGNRTDPNNPFGYGQPGYGNYPRGAIIPPMTDSVTSNQQILHALAVGTGGFTILNTNDFAEGLNRIVRELDEYYVLGYVPPSPAHDGSYHPINVKVDRKGVKLRFRTGYYDVKSPDLLAGKPEGKILEEQAESSQPGEIPVALSAPYFYTEPEVARINLAMQVPAGQLKFEKEKGKFHSKVDVLGIAYREDGSVAARFSDSVRLDLEKKAHKEFTKGVFFYQNNFKIAPGSYRLKIVMSDGGQKFGKYEMPLVITPFDEERLQMSGVALSNDLRRASDLTAGIEAALLEERTPLVVKGIELTPSPDRHFKKDQQVGMYLEVYEPMLTDPVPPRVGVIFNVIDRRTNQQVFTSNTVPLDPYIEKERPVIPVGLFLPVDKLQAGEYRLEVQARNSAGHISASRTANFVLE